MAQSPLPEVQKAQKGRMYFYWGWSRDAFSTSSIHFKGPDYDFTLRDLGRLINRSNLD